MTLIKSIKELVSEKDFFAKRGKTENSVVGLGIGYMMEEAQIPDFTCKGYDFNSKKILKDYASELRKVRYSDKMNVFFTNLRNDAGVDNYIKCACKFTYVIEEFSYKFPPQLNDAFKDIVYSALDNEKKTELQLMQLVMLSRLPSLCVGQIRDNFMKIDADKIPEKFIPLYDLAENYFL